MDSMVIGSFPDTSSITTVGNLRRGTKDCTKNYYATSCYSPKASQHKRKIQKEYNFLRFRQPSLKHLYKGIEGGPTYQECNRKYVVKMTPKSSFEYDPQSPDRKNILESFKDFLHAFYLFCTPYSSIAAVLNIISASLLAVEKLSDISLVFFIGVLQAIIPNLFMSIYMAGLNQLSDVEIDKINKPYLPLTSGKISVTTGVFIIASSFILCLWLGWIIGSWPSFWANISFAVIWTVYAINVPLLRWKRYPVRSAMISFASFAITFPIGYFFHMQTFVFKRPAFFTRPLIFAIAFMSFYSIALSLLKDIPDIEGDRAFGVQSFSTRLGPKRVFWICISLFEIAFGVALLMGATSSCLWSRIVTVLGHAILASVVWYHAKTIDLRSKTSIASFYMFSWKILYVEYFLMPFVR